MHIMLNPSKWEKIKFSQDTFKLQLKLCHWSEPMKTHVIGQSLIECIVMSYYLLPPVNHHQQIDLFSYHNYNNRLRLANQKPNTNYIIIIRMNFFKCEYLSFYAVYELETLRIYCYSPSLCIDKVLSKSEIRPKIWLEAL